MKKFGSWVQPEPEGQETSHKSTEPGYSKKKTKEEILKLFGLWALSPTPRPKSKLKPHMVAKKRIIAKIRRAVKRPFLKSKLKPHMNAKKRIIAKIRPAVRRLMSVRRQRPKIRRR